MKTPKSLYSRLALITSVTLVVGYFVVYAAWSSLTVGEVAPGATVTTGLMTKIKDNFDYINTQVSNFSFSSGNVGIGINPVSKLQVSGATTSTAFQIYPISARPSATSPELYQPVDGHLGIATNDAERIRIDANGNVGIGTTTPGQKLDIVAGYGRVQSGYSWLTNSDVRYKKDIKTIDNSLNKILNLRGVYYKVKNGNENENIGVIAQELEKEFPELVVTEANGYKSVKYSEIVAPLINAIKELKSQKDSEIEQLKKRIELLENR